MYAALRTAVGLLSRRGPLLSRLRSRAAAPPLGPAVVAAILGLVFVFVDRPTAVDAQFRPLDPVISPYHDGFEVGKWLRISDGMAPKDRSERYSKIPWKERTYSYGVVKRLPGDETIFEIPKIIVGKVLLKTSPHQRPTSFSIDSVSDQELGNVTSFKSEFATRLSMPSPAWFNHHVQVLVGAEICLGFYHCEAKLRESMILAMREPEKVPMEEPGFMEHEPVSLTMNAQRRLDEISKMIIYFLFRAAPALRKYNKGDHVTVRLMDGWVNCLPNDTIWLQYAKKLELPYRDQLFVCGSIKTALRDYCVMTARLRLSTPPYPDVKGRPFREEDARDLNPMISKRPVEPVAPKL